jgi:starch phosphorylase
VTDLDQLRRLVPMADDPEFQTRWREVKRLNKDRLAAYARRTQGAILDADRLFSCQVKRFHEYKRQLLNILHAITLYNRIKEGKDDGSVPRTVLLAGKAAPGYHHAKLIIKLANAVAKLVNADPAVEEHLRVVFLADYGVSLAEYIIPAAELSEQISTAGMEASGTGNTADQVEAQRASGYDPWDCYHADPELRATLDQIAGDLLSPADPGLFQPLLDRLLDEGDPFMVLADYTSYLQCQERVSQAYRDERRWTRMSILNTANTGRFSSDRAIREYSEEIWKVRPVHVKM